jgi:hypothetical protein
VGPPRRSQRRPSPTRHLAKRGTGLAPATRVEPRARFVKCLDSSLCHARIAKKNVGLIITISIATCGLRTSRGRSSSKGACSSTKRPRRRRVGSRAPRLSPPRRSVRPRPGPSFTRPGSPPEYSTLPPPAPRASRDCFDDEHFVHLELGVPGERDSSEDPSPLTVRRVVLIR